MNYKKKDTIPTMYKVMEINNISLDELLSNFSMFNSLHNILKANLKTTLNLLRWKNVSTDVSELDYTNREYRKWCTLTFALGCLYGWDYPQTVKQLIFNYVRAGCHDDEHFADELLQIFKTRILPFDSLYDMARIILTSADRI